MDMLSVDGLEQKPRALCTTGWALDTAFLNTLLDKAKTVDIVSFDVFDTALTRLVDSPVDVFAALEQRLTEQYGETAKHFAVMRKQAERSAREAAHERNGAEEVSLDEIYVALAQQNPEQRAIVREAKELELTLERELIIPVPDVLEAARRLREMGKPYIFVSDMYLPSEAIARMLREAGYEGWSELYVSVETGLTKASGRQWLMVRDRLGEQTSILHVGDDQHADVETPLKYNVSTLAYLRARSERRVGAKLNPAILPFSYAQRASVLQSRADLQKEQKAADVWYQTGRTMGALVVGTFVKWLAEKVQNYEIDQLYFCARDGWLIQNAWKAAGLDQKTGVRDHYLAVSRRPLNLACGYADSSPLKLDAALVKFLSDATPGTKIATTLARARLDQDAVLLKAMKAEFGTLDAPWQADTGGRFAAILQEHADIVHACLADEYAALTGYLAQEGVGSSARAAIIDMGWHGTMQRSLNRLLSGMTRAPVTLTGFYYGLWTPAQGNRYAAGWMEPLFANDFVPFWEQPEMMGAVDILEELHSAPHGTVSSYKKVEGRWQAVFADNPAEMKQYETVTTHFQQGTIDAVAELFSSGVSGTLTLDDLTPDAARAALGSMLLSPTMEEVAMFSQLGHCTTFDHVTFKSIVSTGCPGKTDERWEKYWDSSWKMGTLWAWYHEAKTGHASDVTSMREFARAAVPATFGTSATRLVEQFK